MATLDNPNNYTDPSTVSVVPTGNKWGLILGLVGIVLSLLFTMTGMIDYSGTKSNWLSSTISWGATIAIIYMALNAHKNDDLGGYLSIGRAAKMGAYLGLISGILVAIYTFVYFKFIQPDFMSTIMDTAISNAEDKGQDPEAVKKGMEMMSWMFNPGAMAVMGFLGSILMDTIFGLIIGLFIKKDPPRPF
jgi:hypothetical protein